MRRRRGAASAVGRDLTTGPVGGTLIAFSMPVLASSILQSLQGSINAIWVGRFLGEGGIAATANANLVFFLLISLIFGAGMAATIFIGQAIGARDPAQARRVLLNCIALFMGVSLLIAAAGIMLTPLILTAMQTPPAALPLATTYLRVIFTAMPLVNILALLTMAMRGVGDARTPFRAMMAVAALDAVLNPVLIAGLGPAPRLGIAGAAGATLLAQGIVLVVLLHVMRRRQDVLALRIKDIIDFRPDWPLIRRIALKGLPMGLEMIVLSISAILMIALVNDFGTRTSAAYGIAVQLWTYVHMPAMAIGQAITAIAAQCIGAGLWHRVSRIVRMGVLFNLALTGAIIALLYVLERPALTLFLPHDRAAVDVARHINAIALWSYLPFGMTFVLFGVVRAAGVTSAPLVVLLVTSLGLRIPFAFLLVGRMGLDAVWWSFPLGFCASTLLAAAYYRSGRWRHAPLTMPDTASDAPETGLGLPTQLAAQHQPAGA